jgi:hypothetical protein
MTAARIFTPENRLSKILLATDAPTSDDLIADASMRVAQLEGAIRAYVAEQLKEIMAFANAGEDVLFAEARTLGDKALNVAEVASAAGMDAVGEVARGISAMVDNLVSSGVWHTDALRLHLNALALVNRGGGERTPESDLILERLRGMREAVGVLE